eukprot:Skav233938  [mRNA]  locus=scaffold2378:21962:24413:- [translate_table: standard]
MYRSSSALDREAEAGTAGGGCLQFDYTVEKTFVCTSASQGRSLSTVTASTQGYGRRNPRQWRPSLPSDATDGSQRPAAKKTLWEHAGEMKKWQGVRDIHQVLQCFANIKRDGLTPDTYCYNIIINLFGKLGQLEESERWFQKMESSGIDADANSFAVLMDAYGIDMQIQKVEWCMAEMERRNLIPTESHFSILIKAYARQATSGGANERKQASEAAEAVFQDLVARGLKPALLTFAAMVDMYAQQGKPTEAEEVLAQKLHHFPMDKKDCCMMMNAHANAVCGKPEDGLHVDEAIRWQEKIKADFGFSSIQVYDYTVLLKACARSKPKQVDLACRLFCEQVQGGIQPDHFNIQTLHSVGGAQNAATINKVIKEMGIDTGKLKADFQAVGDEYNYDEKLNRKLWKLKIETDGSD